MEINYWAVLACGIVSMILGAIWYGPLFGKMWMQIVKADPTDIEARKKMQKTAGPLYVIQFVLTLFQAWALAHFIFGWGVRTGGMPPSAVENAFVIWAAFIMPTIAGASMWNNDSVKISWARFLIQAGYQVLNFVVFALILSMWL